MTSRNDKIFPLFWYICSIVRAFFLISILTFSIFAAAAGEISYIDVHRAKQLHDDGALFIDARSLAERKAGIIDGSQSMNSSEVEDMAQHIVADKDKPVVTYCAAGARASKVANQLKVLGYANLYVIAEGQGYTNWEKAGYPTSR